MKDNYYSIPIIDVKTPTKYPIDYKNVEYNDFALFILKTPAVYSRSVQPICLPQQYEDFSNQKATAAGWGMTNITLLLSPVLRKVELSVIPRPDYRCKMLTTLITKNKNGEPQDPCSGDSGTQKTYDGNFLVKDFAPPPLFRIA